MGAYADVRILLVSAISSGQGKTTVTAALARKLVRQGLRVKLEGVLSVSISSGGAAPGTVVKAGDRVEWACGTGVLGATILQAEGRRRQPAVEFSRGERVVVGEVWA